MILKAPFPALAHRIELPEAELRNEFNRLGTVRSFQMMDESFRTIIVSTTDKRHRYAFEMTEKKAMELFLFIERYSGQKMNVEATDGTYNGFMTENFGLEHIRRAGIADSNAMASVELEFREV